MINQMTISIHKKIMAILLFCTCLSIYTTFTGCSKSENIITTLADANHACIGVMTGTTSEQIAMRRFPDASIKTFESVMDAVAALKTHQLDAVLTDYPTAFNVVKHNPGYQFLPEPVSKEETAIAVKKNNDDLLEAVDGIISELKRDGTLEDMKNRWFKMDLTPYDNVLISLPKEGDVLKIGANATREPFCFIGADREVTGHDGELARRIAAKLNRPVEFTEMKFSALLPALQSGKIDLIVTGMSITEERRKLVDFTQPYFSNAQVLLVKKPEGSPASNNIMSSPEDIRDKKVGVYTGTIHDAFVAATYPNAEINRFEGTADMVLALKTEKIQAAFMDLLSARVILKNNEEIGILSDDVLTKPLGIGFSKDNPALRDRFNAFLKKSKADGTYNEMIDRWCTNDPEKAEMPQFDVPETGEKWVAGVSVADLPYVAVINGRYVGFDIEMLQRFASHEGIRLEISTMAFSSLVAALASGKVDMIADGIAITDERKKQIDFSDSYLDFKTAVVALKKNIAAYNDNTHGSPVNTVSFFQRVAESFHNNIILENRYLLIFKGLANTILISILSTVFGTLLGALICFLRMSNRKILSALARTYISILRGTPVLVLLMIIFYIVFASVNIDPILVAVVAFGMNFAAYVSEMFRTGIESVDRGQSEAGTAMGFTGIGTFNYIVLPQALKYILPVYKGEFISLVKMTSVVGYIAVQDLTKAGDIIRSRTFDAFFPLIMVAVIYLSISWLLTLSLGYVEAVVDTKSGRKVKKG